MHKLDRTCGHLERSHGLRFRAPEFLKAFDIFGSELEGPLRGVPSSVLKALDISQ